MDLRDQFSAIQEDNSTTLEDIWHALSSVQWDASTSIEKQWVKIHEVLSDSETWEYGDFRKRLNTPCPTYMGPVFDDIRLIVRECMTRFTYTELAETLGNLFNPSLALFVYAVATEQSLYGYDEEEED